MRECLCHEEVANHSCFLLDERTRSKVDEVPPKARLDVAGFTIREVAIWRGDANHDGALCAIALKVYRVAATEPVCSLRDHIDGEDGFIDSHPMP